MSFKKTTIIINLSLALLLSACATNRSWSDEQKASLPNLRIAPPTFDQNSYDNPNAKDSNLYAKDTAGLQAQGNNSGGGLVGFALLAIDGAVVAVQQTKFNAKNKQHFDAVQKQIDSQSETQLAEKVTHTILSNTFFANKMTADSKNIFKLNVNKHGLVRTAYTNVDDMKMFYGIKAYASLINQNSEELLGQTLSGQSSTTATMTELMSDDFSVLNKMKDEAQQNIARQLELQLITRTTSKAEKEAATQLIKEQSEKNKAEQKAKKEAAKTATDNERKSS